ncbi:hypothetical protein TNCV_3136091 [Trichonephila clavipes]|nr:hypothetical protein TNCV_3136091 [Trichonephila clavipes]
MLEMSRQAARESSRKGLMLPYKNQEIIALKQSVTRRRWDKYHQIPQKLVESVPRRLEDIIKAKGHATKDD